MRLQDRAAVAAKAGRSWAAALMITPHQLHRGRRAHIKAQGRLANGRATLNGTDDPVTQISGQRNWHGTPRGQSQPPLLNQPSRFYASARRSNSPVRPAIGHNT